jgi:hypothetical protein
MLDVDAPHRGKVVRCSDLPWCIIMQTLVDRPAEAWQANARTVPPFGAFGWRD